MLELQQILLVEDSQLDAMLFERTLQLNGFQGNIKSCVAVKDAIDYIKNTSGDPKSTTKLIVLDMFLNGDYGGELLSFLSDPQYAHLKVIVVTASKPLIDNEPILSCGNVIGILDKPFRYDDFRELLLTENVYS